MTGFAHHRPENRQAGVGGRVLSPPGAGQRTTTAAAIAAASSSVGAGRASRFTWLRTRIAE